MTIDLKQNLILQRQMKNAINRLLKSTISEIDKHQQLSICKKGFEIKCKGGKKFRIIFEVKEVSE